MIYIYVVPGGNEEYDDNTEEEKDEDSDDEEKVDDWVCCDRCMKWYHTLCVVEKWPQNKPPSDDGDEKWFCC